jgi:hypothetical protein
MFQGPLFRKTVTGQELFLLFLTANRLYDDKCPRNIMHKYSKSSIKTINVLSNMVMNPFTDLILNTCILCPLFQNAHFMKKIPAGAEASNILVGELNVLEKPLSAFIRLSEASILGDLTEVPVPTRFIFILLGPAVSQF